MGRSAQYWNLISEPIALAHSLLLGGRQRTVWLEAGLIRSLLRMPLPLLLQNFPWKINL